METFQDIGRHIQDLTGEEMEGLLEAAGKDMDDVLSARLLLHCLILLANETGQPTGQDLIEPEQQPGSSDKVTFCSPDWNSLNPKLY